MKALIYKIIQKKRVKPQKNKHKISKNRTNKKIQRFKKQLMSNNLKKEQYKCKLRVFSNKVRKYNNKMNNSKQNNMRIFRQNRELMILYNKKIQMNKIMNRLNICRQSKLMII